MTSNCMLDSLLKYSSYFLALAALAAHRIFLFGDIIEIIVFTGSSSNQLIECNFTLEDANLYQFFCLELNLQGEKKKKKKEMKDSPPGCY